MLIHLDSFGQEFCLKLTQDQSHSLANPTYYTEYIPAYSSTFN